MKDELASLLLDLDFLSDDGYLCFGLEYDYSRKSCWIESSGSNRCLRGVDADPMHLKELVKSF
jgi:hypothetical protein